MKSLSADLKTYLQERARALAKDKGKTIEKFDDEFNFIGSGVLDSVEFVGFLEELEHHFALSIDFHNIDPVEFTSIGGIVRNLLPPQEPQAKPQSGRRGEE